MGSGTVCWVIGEVSALTGTDCCFMLQYLSKAKLENTQQTAPQLICSVLHNGTGLTLEFLTLPVTCCFMHRLQAASAALSKPETYGLFFRWVSWNDKTQSQMYSTSKAISSICTSALAYTSRQSCREYATRPKAIIHTSTGPAPGGVYLKWKEMAEQPEMSQQLSQSVPALLLLACCCLCCSLLQDLSSHCLLLLWLMLRQAATCLSPVSQLL